MSGAGGGGHAQLRWWAVGLLLIGCALAVATGLSALRAHRAARDALPLREGSLAVPGLHREAWVLRDARGVPHVEAGSAHDAYLALGFVHAQDRLAQLLWLRRAARGRLAESVGEAGFAADRRARLLGIARHAEAAWERATGEERAVLEAYSAGVNAQLDPIRAGAVGLPPALAGVEEQLERWTPADCFAVLKLYAWELGGSLEESLVLSELIERFGGFDARIFFPEGSGLDVLPEPGGEVVREATAAHRQRLASPAPAGATPPRPPETVPLRGLPGLYAAGGGSGAWVVGGAHARRGRPLLATALHFNPSVPGAFYEVHLRGGDLDVAGATLAGVPVFWTGFNPQVAWASVHAPAVVTDLYVETRHPEDGSRYHDGQRWRRLEERVEEIAVRDAPTERLVVQETRHGTLVNPLLAVPREPLALRWTGALPGSGIAGFLRVARARGAEELRRALAEHHEPVLAVTYADGEGRAGVQVAGFVPQRPQLPGLLPVPGRDPSYDWIGPIAPAQLPARQLEGGRGFAVVADGRFGGASEAVTIEWLWRPGVRTERLEALLEEATRGGLLELRALLAVQRDARSLRAGEVVGAALALAAAPEGLAPEARRTAELLQSWDREMLPGSVGAAVYQVFLDQLLHEFFAPGMGVELLERYLALDRVDPSTLAGAVLAGAGAGGGADLWSRPEAVRRALRQSLRGTWLRLSVELGANPERWTLGRLRALRSGPLGTPLRDAGALRLGGFPGLGDAASLLGAAYRLLDGFDAHATPTYRLLVDCADLDEALTAFPPGRSEPSSRVASPAADGPWLDGRPSLLATSPLAVEEGAVFRLRLEPAR